MDLASFRAALLAASNPARATHGVGYFPTAMRHLGVAVPELRRALRPLVLAQRAQPDPGLVQALWSSGAFEERQAAYELLAAVPRLRRALSREAVLALAEGNDNWCSVDTYGCYVLGPAWREGLVKDGDIAALSASPDRWRRRSAIVATVALNTRARGGKGDVPRTLATCARHAEERDDMVEKALSWALRSCIEHDAAAIAAFIAEHPVSARVRREVGNKLRTGRKNP